MNKVIMIGRLTREPDIRYTQGQDQMCIARFTLAVDRKGRRQEGQQNADFPSCVAFGKAGEFIEKWIKKGTKIAITGRLQNRILHEPRRRKGLHDGRRMRRCGIRGKQGGRIRETERRKRPGAERGIHADAGRGRRRL